MSRESGAVKKSRSPPCRGGREGPNRDRDWEGEVGSGIPHLTPILSAPKGGEGEVGMFR